MNDLLQAINKFTKWRTVFAGWQLGTRPIGDPECAAVRDHREITMLLRAEVNALTALMVAKGIFTSDEFDRQLIEEINHLERSYENRFPGFRSSLEGMVLDQRAAETVKNWRP